MLSRCTLLRPRLRASTSIVTRSRNTRLAATLIVFAAVMPGIFVVIPMVMAIIVTLAVTITGSNHTGRHERHQSQQQAGRSNSTHIRILVKVACDIHTRAAKLRVEQVARRFPSALSLTDREALDDASARWGAQLWGRC
jgi:hypothetical protein